MQKAVTRQLSRLSQSPFFECRPNRSAYSRNAHVATTIITLQFLFAQLMPKMDEVGDGMSSINPTRDIVTAALVRY